MSKTKGWERVCIKDICESIIDCVNKTAPTVDYPTPYKMIRTTNVKAGWVHLSDVKYVTEEVFKTWTRRAVPQKGDVILTREAPLGEVGMLRGDESVFLGQRLVQYRADTSKLDNRFLLYCFQADDLQGQIKALGSGATVEHMRVPDAEKLTLLLPPLPVQKRIADILSAYDDLIENNTRRIKILEEMARSLYDEWFVKFRFPGHEQTKLVDSELGLIPKGWEVKKLGNAIQFQNGKSIKPSENAKYPVYGSNGIIGKTNEAKYRNGIIIGRVGAYCGSIAYCKSEFWGSDNTIIATSCSERFGINLSYFVLQALNLRHYAGGSAQPLLTQTVIKEIPVIIPSLEVNQKFESITEKLWGLKIVLESKNFNLRQTRDLLLPKLISGEINVEKLEVTEDEEAINSAA